MDYRQAAAYIGELPKFTKKHTLEHTKEFLKRLGNPAQDRKIIHVAGTNGKGSVCAYIREILMAEGKKTGFFTSPHLISVNERIQINGSQIDDDTFLSVFTDVHSIAREMESDGAGHPSYFEFLFGMGMTAFASADVEYIILETGLGGRLDATNSVFHPALSVITSISLDHTDILGNSIGQIAREKAGIIKEGVPVFFDGSSREAARIIQNVAEQRNAPCREISNNAFEILEVGRKSIAFSRANAYDNVTWQIPICGIYQVMNAVLAIEAAEYLLGKEDIHPRRWQQALASIHFEGRMEEAAPHIFIDGAHNPGAAEAFVQSIDALYPDGYAPMVVLFSAAADKKYEQMIACLCRKLNVRTYIVTEIEDKRKIPAEELGRVFQRYTDRKVICKEKVKDALETALQERGDGEVYCLGSLYLAGSVKILLAGGEQNA